MFAQASGAWQRLVQEDEQGQPDACAWAPRECVGRSRMLIWNRRGVSAHARRCQGLLVRYLGMYVHMGGLAGWRARCGGVARRALAPLRAYAPPPTLRVESSTVTAASRHLAAHRVPAGAQAQVKTFWRRVSARCAGTCNLGTCPAPRTNGELCRGHSWEMVPS